MSSADAPDPVRFDLSSTFARLAVRFCALIDRRGEMERRELLEEAHALLPKLYVAALSLPATRPRRPVRRRAEPPGESGRARLRELAALIGARRDTYRAFFDPYDQEAEPLPGSLADDLCGIYGDLSAGMAHWEAGETEDAVWEWRHSFQAHWGEHATGALRALYWLSCRHGLGPARTPEPA